MNKQGSQIVGTHVTSVKDQKPVGKVQALVIDQQNHKVSGLLIKDDPLFSAQVIPIDKIKDIKEEVEIETPEQIQRANDLFKEPKKDTDETGKFVEKTKVKTTQGEDVGTVKDFLFNTDTGEIEEYMIKTTDQKDVAIKRNEITKLDQASITVDMKIVDDNKASPLQQSATSKPTEKKKGQTKEKIQGVFDIITQGLSKITSSNKDEELVGKYVTKNILSKEDTVIAKQGEMITHALLENARKNQMDDLLRQYSSEKLPQ